jgi:Phage tail lysozyme
MIPLLGIIADLFPEIVKQLGGPLHEQSASVQDQIIDAIKKATNLENPQSVDPQVVKNAIENTQQVTKDALRKDLQEIALEELKERNRANEEAQRVELEQYRIDAEERERVRDQQYQAFLQRLQSVREARSAERHLADDRNPLAWVAPILAFVLVGMIWYLLHAILAAREEVINRDVFNVVLGALVTAFTTVVAYYFGSSLGSSAKDEALKNGDLVANPKAKPAGSTDQSGDDSASDTAPSTWPGHGSDGANRVSKSTATLSGVYGLFRKKAPGIMRDLIRDLGISEAQAAGILGNIGWECGGFRQLQEQNPVMGGPGGLGWCQWTASRRTEFEQWLRDNGFNYQNDAANYGFLLNELRGSQAASVSAVRRTPSVETATGEFMRVFERPAARYAHLDDRIGLAKLALQEYGRAFNV